MEKAELIEGFTVSYAQNGEDIILAGFFPKDKNDGFYVDVGANDPDDCSVTKHFYDRGWHGINIEPIKKHYDDLVTKRTRDTNLKIGVGDKEDTLTLREYAGTGLSTFSETMKESYSRANGGMNPGIVDNYKDVKVRVVPIRDIFREQNITAIDFMKVDVEGFEYEVLKGNDWDLYRPRVICIEANHVITDWHKLLISNGYEKIFFDGLNEYLIDSRAKPSLKFDYVEAVINANPVSERFVAAVRYAYIAREEYDKQVKMRDERIDQLSAEVGHLERYNQELLHQLDDIISLRKHVRKVALKHIRRIDDKITHRLQRESEYLPPKPVKVSDTATVERMLAAAEECDSQTYAKINKNTQDPAGLRHYIRTKHVAKALIKRGKKRA